MIAIVHLLAGAAIGVTFDDLVIVVLLSFFTHYLMDLLPHLDAETFASRHLPYSWNQFISLIIDSTAALGLSLLFFFTHERWAFIMVATIASLTPDLLIPLERYRWFWPMRRFHDIFHWNKERANSWNWYLAALITPSIFVVVSSAILLWTL